MMLIELRAIRLLYQESTGEIRIGLLGRNSDLEPAKPEHKPEPAKPEPKSNLKPYMSELSQIQNQILSQGT